ncbi:MAG: L,D-transpeptidase family protein [Sphingomicrobium sp.]
MNLARAAILMSALTLMIATPAIASGSKVSSPLQLAKQAERLKPGEWVWAGKIAPTGPVLVYVDLERQRATVYRNGVRIAVTTISSGKAGYDTPTGVFTILEKDADHRSRTYDNAPMPYNLRLTWKGVAMHAGNLPGFPASHGCVRLPLEFSKLLFASMPMGGTVVIAGGNSDPVKRPPAGVLAPIFAGVTPQRTTIVGGSHDFSWKGAAAPSGPVSIIVSTGDQQVVVLRNGVEIGRAKARVQQITSETQVMTLTKAGGAGPQWIQVGVSDLAHRDADIISTQGVEQMQLPPEFVANMRAVITPGTTVLVTQASVTTDTTGAQTTVLASDPAEK